VANIPKVWNGTAFIELEAAATVAPAASTTVVGIVQLTDSTSSTSTTTAATPNSVKSAYDLAGSANTTAGTAIPKNTVTAAGDILYASGSATVARLGIGTASQVLGIAAGVPAWTTPAGGGGMTIIGTATPTGVTSFAFSSIPGSYKHLKIVYVGAYMSNNSTYFSLRLNNSSTAVYDWFATHLTSTYSYGRAESAAQIGNSDAAIIPNADYSGAQAYQTASGEIEIYRYTDTQQRYVTWSSLYYNPSGAVMRLIQGSGRWNNTANAVTSVDFVRTSGAGSISGGTFYLYGVS